MPTPNPRALRTLAAPLAFAALALCLPLKTPAQTPAPTTAPSTEAALKTRLLHQPLYLRGRWNSDHLAFDATGDLLGPRVTHPYTLCGVDITRVQLKPSGLLLEGHRVGLELVPTPTRKPLREKIQIEIAPSPSGNYAPALNTIFANGLADFLPSGPPPVTALQHSSAAPAAPAPSQENVTGPVKPPVLVRSVPPAFTPAANQLQYGGTVVVSAIVLADGSVSHLRVLKPIGLGLDEQALVAVSRYQFKPALADGKPIPFQLDINVKFVPETLPPASAVTID